MRVQVTTNKDRQKSHEGCPYFTAELTDRGRTIGTGSAIVDFSGSRVMVYRVDVDDTNRGSGLGLALMLALLQRALKEGAVDTWFVHLVADEEESPNIQNYYGRMGFMSDEGYGEVDRPGQQHPMMGMMGPVITNIQMWLGLERYRQTVLNISHV